MINFVLICAPNPEYPHWQGLSEIALSMTYSLRELGHRTEITTDPSIVTGKTLVFGAHLLPKFGGSIEGGNYIIFNLEQVTENSPWMTLEYLEIMKRYEVWDYSLANVEELRKLGVTAKHCEIGYHLCMSNLRRGKSAGITGGGTAVVKVDYVNWSTQGLPVGVFDVLWYGSMNERRQKIIDDLRDAGLNVVIANGYGAWRDKYINRAKIILNMNYYDSAIFNICRVAPLLANEKCVISEESKESDAYRDAVAFAHYDRIVDMCKAYVKDDSERKILAKRGFEEIKKRDQVEILSKVLTC